jgi:putative PIN family toxin of toxin-antitoxin system
VTNIVLDTNVLVSALISSKGSPAEILGMLLGPKEQGDWGAPLLICTDSRIMAEYENVLLREKFHFDPHDVSVLLGAILRMGVAITASPVEKWFADENDRKFYEVAREAAAYLITGNKRHFPDEPTVVSPSEFLYQFASRRLH